MGGRKMNRIDWPRRRNGLRRRASTPRVVKRERLLRPTGWLLRLLVLILVAGPALFLSSPGYVAFANRMPDLEKLTAPMHADTMIYASDGTTVLADLHGPGYQHRGAVRSEEHTSELQSRSDLVCRLLLEKKKNST